ncbi:MAG: hypothetical protein Q9167_003609 [Letrouitia subvulpina]
MQLNWLFQDFRSEKGLYSIIQSEYDRAASSRSSSRHKSANSKASPVTRKTRLLPLPTNVKGKDLFDSMVWKDPVTTSVFYRFVASLRKRIREDVQATTPTHRFIRTIRDSRRLVRCYTQNIDGLELREGLSMDLALGKGTRTRFMKKTKEMPRHGASPNLGGQPDNGCEVVPLHGDLLTLRCTLCQQTCGWEEVDPEGFFLKGRAPSCFSCATSDRQRREKGRRGTKVGTLRPNVVLYGEEHPAADDIGAITANDLSLAPDVLLILGTSLHVHGFKILVKEFAKCVHARPSGKGKVIFVNLSKPSESVWKDTIDYWVSMDCDEWIGALRRHRPDLWQIQTELKMKLKKTGIERVNQANYDKENRNTNLLKNKAPTNSRCALASKEPKKPLQDTHVGGRTSKHEPMALLHEQRENTQLMTPPSSGHRERYETPSRKRSRMLEECEDIGTQRMKHKKVKVDIRIASSANKGVDSKVLDAPKNALVPKSQQTTYWETLAKRKKTMFSIWED